MIAATNCGDFRPEVCANKNGNSSQNTTMEDLFDYDSASSDDDHELADDDSACLLIGDILHPDDGGHDWIHSLSPKERFVFSMECMDVLDSLVPRRCSSMGIECGDHDIHNLNTCPQEPEVKNIVDVEPCSPKHPLEDEELAVLLIGDVLQPSRSEEGRIQSCSEQERDAFSAECLAVLSSLVPTRC